MDTEQGSASQPSSDTGMPLAAPCPVSPSYADAPRPIWPTVIGILSILQGFFWASCIGLTVAMRAMHPVQEEPSPEGWWGAVRPALGVVVLVLPILVVVAGIQLIRHRPSGRTLHILYGIVTLLVHGVLFASGAVSMYPRYSENSMLGAYGVGLAVGALLSMGYPVFVLIWFLRPKIRRQMMAWSQTRFPSETLMDVAPAHESRECKEPAMEMEAASKEEPTFTKAQVADLQKRRELEKRFVGGVRWFYWIAGLSIANSVVLLVGGTWGFLVALGTTQVISAVGVGLAEQVGPMAKYLTFAAAVAVALLFVAFGYLAEQRYRWALILGMVLYALDGLLCLVFQDFLVAGFHLLALFGLYGGLKAFSELRKLDATIGAGAFSSGPATGSNVPPPIE